MKKKFKQFNSSRVLQYATGIALALSLAGCNTTPAVSANNPYLAGTKPWSSTVNASSASSIRTGFLSDQSWESATNGWGPIELDLSNGEDGTEDGGKISLSGVSYDKGLGVHADSSITFNLAGACSRFTASVGLDDEVRDQDEYGNIIFRVFGDDTKLYDSGGMNRNNVTQNIDIDVSNRTNLTLVVDQNQNSTEGDRSSWYDHADWANARVECDKPITPQPPTPTSAKIQFENFKTGEGTGYHDNDATNQGGMYRTSEGVDIHKRADADGYNIGWSGAGEWMKYDLNLAAGNYDLNLRYAAWQDQQVEISVDNVKIQTSSLPGNSTFDQYQIFKISNLNLSADAHVIKVAYVGSSPALNLDWMEFKPTNTTPQPPSPTSAKIQFENFKAGEGTGYHDTETINQGGLYRTNEGVDLEQRANPEGYNIGWTKAGEWMKYDLNLAAGTYDLNIKFATWGTQKLSISIDDVEIPSSSLPDTAGFDAYQMFKVSSFNLSAGAHVVKVAYAETSPAVNLDWMEFTESNGTTPTTPEPPTPTGSVVSTDFVGSNATIPNPERGIHGYSDDLTWVSESSLQAQANLGYRLVRSYVRIDSYRNSTFDNNWLSNLEQGFAKLRRTGLKTILRFSYNFPGNDYLNAPDAPLYLVLQHIQQIKPILARNADVVAFWQAGFIGAWGEWHSSGNGLDSAQNKITIRNALLDAVPNGSFLQVRYPIDLRNWNSNAPSENEAFTNNARIGIYNDCFMAGDSDTGTYDGGLNDPLREYAKKMAQVTPFGVETCNAGGRLRTSCNDILTEGRDYAVTYLNDYFYNDFMDNWKANGCYDQVSRLIGYRFRLTYASHQKTATRGSGWTLQLNVSNDGWARLFNPRALKVVLRNKATGASFAQNINQVDPRRWLPSSNTSVTAAFNIPNQTAAGDYDILIGLPDAAPSLANDARYAIRFANSDNDALNQAWESNNGLFKIGTTLTIN